MDSRRRLTHVLSRRMHSTVGRVEEMLGRFNTSKKDTERCGKNSCEGILSQVMDLGKMVTTSLSLSISSGFPSIMILHTWV